MLKYYVVYPAMSISQPNPSWKHRQHLPRCFQETPWPLDHLHPSARPCPSLRSPESGSEKFWGPEQPRVAWEKSKVSQRHVVANKDMDFPCLHLQKNIIANCNVKNVWPKNPPHIFCSVPSMRSAQVVVINYFDVFVCLKVYNDNKSLAQTGMYHLWRNLTRFLSNI